MHLLSRNTVCLCVHLLHTEHDSLVKAGVKILDSEGKEIQDPRRDPIIRIKQALEDLIRYDACIALLKSSIQDEDGDEE